MFDKLNAIVQKNIIQKNAVKLLYSYRRILLSWATGCGKTLASLKMIQEYNKRKPNARGYIICKESNHIDNWQKDIEAHNMSFINNISNIFLYASLHKYRDKGFVDFVILDECHAITDNRLEHLKKIIGPHTLVIMLSATVTYTKGYLLRMICGVYKEDHISITEAIDMEILPSPKVFIHKYILDDTYNTETYIYTQGVVSKRIVIKCNWKDWKVYSKENAHLELHIKCTQFEAYNMVSEEIRTWGDKYENEEKQWMRNKWVNLGSKRKRMMAEFKTNIAKQLLKDKFKDSRYICFTGSKIQCGKLGRLNSIHSGKTKKYNLAKKERFNDKKINNLFVVNMFKESMNLEDIEKGLIVQLDNVKLSFIQMLGRVFRSALPEMHIIVWENTQDERYLNNVMKEFDKQYVTIIKNNKICV